MTAELQAEAVERGTQSPGADCQMLLNQLREITGIQDPSCLHNALKAANGDLTEAVTILTEEQVKEPVQDAVAAEPSNGEGSAAGKGLQTDVIDLAPDNKDDLQAVIALSLMESPKVQTAERDANRSVNMAHETSAAENKNRSKRKRCEVWGESPNQNNWRRVDDWPVGLKNIGNTCWFSAVIQSLFQLPEFRRLVLGYTLPQSVLENCRSRNEKRNIAFMQELQCLFALMLGTHRRFVDPTAALELLREAFRTAEEQQQDVSEFTHKLLDWLEDAFQLAVNVNSPGDKSENPMVQLFYGTFLTEGIHEGKTFSKIEAFGQYPLQVNGYRDLTECLEGAMVEGEIDEKATTQSVKYGQERWFTKLPPVLTFELSRFEFNQSLGQPEKIHTKLEFPQIIYMDRYLYSSKEAIQKKREEIRLLKEQIAVLQEKLERYMQYGSGPTRFPLPDMLQYVLEFVTAKLPADGPSTQESPVAPSEPQAEPRVLDGPLLQNSALKMEDAEKPEDAASAPADTPPQPEPVSKPVHSSASLTRVPERPAPHVATEEEMSLVRTCLQRWRSEIEQDIQDLKDSIARISQSIEKMYCDPVLRQVPYRLHAVLVHEGQANAGHYWAYIYDQPRKSWLKYNDISVTESSWEELERDSFGGLKNASAYCLMYIKDKMPRYVADDDAGAGQFQKEVEDLPPELKHYIQEDNWRLEQEVEEWEGEQSCKIPQIEPSSASESQDFFSESGPDQPSACEPDLHSLSSQHAMMAKEQTAQAIANTADAYEKNGVEAALCKAFREEYSRLYLLAKETPTPQSDPRLQHVLVYFLQNKAPKRVVERTLLEQFADKNLSYDERSISIMKVAQAKLKEIGPDDVDMEEYKKWHEDYSLFRKVSVYLLTGLELYQNRKYQEALTYLVYAYQSNTTLLRKGPNRGADESLIALYRRKCLLKLNDVAAALFISSDEAHVADGVSILNELIIPCMHLIINNDISQDDLDAIEIMRNRWCSYLGQEDMDATLQMKLGELLPRLLDCSAEVIVLKEPPKIRPNSPYDLCSRFAAVMESIHEASTVTVK
ncbi:ubiquitin carboxyl-terminal hydrolase 28 isoform X9 [Alligator mississippiensis]|uniref:ubiquitinyl hydrolase 1 n=1 Tax=Alligator mississippiensis TaxID=8496 RepID=A0A151P0X4_ALLMI|nr:ubiquitin carboxyl-terminal hydrolase 28 isoform X9 [Alligator mississippiensis]KYO42653.1 ubiquitin carboxyl-terminal hydrolase 25 isoform B [Alligator mississippiensis]